MRVEVQKRKKFINDDRGTSKTKFCLLKILGKNITLVSKKMLLKIHKYKPLTSKLFHNKTC